MSDEPSNTASESMCFVFAFFTEVGRRSEEEVRAGLTDDFAYEDRRSGPSFPSLDPESFSKFVVSTWQTGAAGQPRFEYSVLAVRGERFAAGLLHLDFGNGMLHESIHVMGLDPTLSLVQRVVEFDLDDVDAAIAELDRLPGAADAN